MTKKDDKSPSQKKPSPKPAVKEPPAYLKFSGGYQNSKGGNISGGGKSPSAAGSPIRRTAPGGGGK